MEKETAEQILLWLEAHLRCIQRDVARIRDQGKFALVRTRQADADELKELIAGIKSATQN